MDIYSKRFTVINKFNILEVNMYKLGSEHIVHRNKLTHLNYRIE